MNLHLAFQTFLSYLDIEREKAAKRKLEQIAKSENLDDFLVVEKLQAGRIEYSTAHGFRMLCSDHPELNQFFVTKKGNRFAKAENMPYIYSKCEPPQLVVKSLSYEAIGYGYATAVKLPIAVAGEIDEYPEGTMVVCITEDSEASATFGYANVVPLPYNPSSVYIQKIDMLDTEYAAMLVDFPRFF